MLFDKENFMEPKSIKILTENWLQYALCANDKSIDPDMFFSDSRLFQTRAIMTCLSCPVQKQCLVDAIKTHAKGIRGAVTESERRKLDLEKLLSLVELRLLSRNDFAKRKFSSKRNSKSFVPKMFF